MLSINVGGFVSMHGRGKGTFPEQSANELLSNLNEMCTLTVLETSHPIFLGFIPLVNDILKLSSIMREGMMNISYGKRCRLVMRSDPCAHHFKGL